VLAIGLSGVDNSRSVADAVLSGTTSLQEAYDEARLAQRKISKDTVRLAKMSDAVLAFTASPSPPRLQRMAHGSFFGFSVSMHFAITL